MAYTREEMKKVKGKPRKIRMKFAGKNPNPEKRDEWTGIRPTIFKDKKHPKRYGGTVHQVD